MQSIVAAALKQRILVVILSVVLSVAGLFAYSRLNIEAYPDPVPPLVDIITQNPGQSSEEIERYITIPIEIQMAGLPYIQAIRTVSLFGLSDVKVQFTYDVTYQQASQMVINRLSQLGPLPNGAQPTLSPTSPIGEVFRYRVVGPPGYSAADLKTLQDWVLQRRLKAIPGVVDVTGWGGKTKTYDITVNLDRLLAYGLTLKQVLDGLNNANINVGANTVNIGSQSAIVRSVGQIRSMDDIRNTMLTVRDGAPVLVSDAADVTVGHQPRLGIAGQNDDDDIVQGIVLMRRGAETMPTLGGVLAEVDKINNGGILPPGVRIERIYDRSSLVNITTHTVLHNMVVGVCLIFLIQWLFLGDLRSALIVSATIPFALLFAVVVLVLSGESANLLSMGAIDFGIIVDATVIMVENIFRHLSEGGHSTGPQRRAPGGLTGKLATIFNASTEVTQAIFFSATIIIAGFLPLFTLSGVEGHIFGPMARTYAYALAGGLIATFTVSPALAGLLLPDRMAHVETRAVRVLRRAYEKLRNAALASRRATAAAGLGALALAGLAGGSIGLEFLPKLEEGNMWIRAVMPASISLEAGNDYANRMRRLIKGFPEAETVISQHGRPDDGTDSTGFFNAEFFVPLKPMDQWRKGLDKEALIAEISGALEKGFPGVEFTFSQYIQDNVQEAASGVKGENSVKISGNDLETLAKLGNEIKAVLATVPGITDLAVSASLGQPTIRIDIDRARAARYGLAPGDINATVQAAIGGQAAGDVYESGSDRHFPMVVRLASRYRESLDAISRIQIGVQGANGNITQVPLSEVARVELVSGAYYIYREQQERYVPVKFSVRGRDLGSAILEAQQRVAEQVKIPGGYRIEWVGEFGNLKNALQRLAVAVPIAIGLIGLLLYMSFGSFRDTLLAASAIPLALVGGILGLWVADMPFSISAAIGFVALFGIAAMNGIMVLSCYNRLIDAGRDRDMALYETCSLQMRPVLMTCVAAAVGLLPAAFSTAIGSQVQRPLAIVVVGGTLLAPFLFLTVLPATIGLFSRRRAAVPASHVHDPVAEAT
ncbi:MAG: efflux RND transporter permease subunit [Reyranella sp.]|uniref:efflux RND transporter permease subunit n=1 Tax=Reyranella sp. TaxID=1929291 RepID=UPI001213D52B|nr:CusA/CzcA family heavy metal efflux RND transporter [Reyranella sp.]TAJ84451.1 MAG: efflux RND transporter permease subunit [Reyranella sp.]TBR30935.1 MAG: efflux RND transporter permease subunit [Reyranella sp.]